MIIAPLTVLAAAGAAVWLPPSVTLPWLFLSLGLSVLSYAVCLTPLVRGASWPRALAVVGAVTFAQTSVYAALFVALILDARPGAVVSGEAMLAAVALSSTSEFVLSIALGVSSFAAVVAATALTCILARWGPVSVVVAGLAEASMLVYVLQEALRRRAVETDLARALAQSESSSVAKSVFLATMSHEIRTPLNGVLGMAQAMATGPLADEQRDRLEVIQSSGEALLALLDDVLDFAKIEAGRLVVEAAPFDLGALASQLDRTYRPLAEAKGLTFQLSVTPEAEVVVLGDRNRLRQVLGNLLSNGLKFTDAGGLLLSLSRLDGHVVATVRDTGAGIAADQLASLFVRFSQAQGEGVSGRGGTGLGLAICRELCGLMGGTIEVESVEGLGSEFTVRLPMALASLPPDLKPSAGAPASGDGPLRVLAAEDNLANRKVLSAILDQAGVEVVLVEDGAQAVEAWRAASFDAILMDIQMPVMDGVEAARTIRLEEGRTGRPRTPIIALTANAMTHQRAAYVAAGMDACVAKPIRVEELFAALQGRGDGLVDR